MHVSADRIHRLCSHGADGVRRRHAAINRTRNVANRNSAVAFGHPLSVAAQVCQFLENLRFNVYRFKRFFYQASRAQKSVPLLLHAISKADELAAMVIDVPLTPRPTMFCELEVCTVNVFAD